MFKKLGLLGLSLLAVMAVGAVGASAALANPLVHAGAYTATVKGEQITTNTLSNGVRSVTCPAANSELAGELTEAKAVLTVTPMYAECTSNSSTWATVTTTTPTKAAYNLQWLSGAASPYQLTLELTQNTVIDIWSTKKEDEESKAPLCTLEIPKVGNSAIHGITATNEGSGTTRSVKLEVNSSNVLVKRTSGTAANCGAAEKTTGTYVGNIKGTASKGGSEVGLWIE